MTSYAYKLPPLPIKNDHMLNLDISGSLAHAAMHANDGVKGETYFVERSSRLQMKATVKPNHDMTIGGVVKFGFQVNTSDKVSQRKPSVNDGVDQRKAEIFLLSKRFGELFLGKGNTASDSSTELDLSGTKIAAFSRVKKFGGGLFLRSDASDSFSHNPTRGNAFNNLDGLSRLSRFRYNTPSFGGLKLAASAAENHKQDIALWFKHKFPIAKVVAAAAYTTPVSINDTRGNIIDGSISTLFDNGCNITAAAGTVINKEASRNKPYFYYGKLGYQAHITDAGKTNFSIDYGAFKNMLANNEVGKSYSAAVVQNIDAWNFSVFTSIRKFKVSNTAVNYRDINEVIAGAMFSF
jgi:hypothetical protein